MLSCSLLAGKVSRRQHHKEGLRGGDVASVASRHSPLEEEMFNSSFIQINNGRRGIPGGRNLIDSFLGIPKDDQGQPTSISSWELGHFDHLIQRKKRKEKMKLKKLNKKIDLVRAKQQDPKVYKQSVTIKMTELQRQVLHIEDTDNSDVSQVKDTTLPCGHVKHTENSGRVSSLNSHIRRGRFSSGGPKRKPSQSKASQANDASLITKRRCAVSSQRIRTGFSNVMLMTGCNNRLFVITGKLGRPPALPSDQSFSSGSSSLTFQRAIDGCSLWEFSPSTSSDKHCIPTPGIPMSDAQCFTSNSTHLFFICGSAHGLSESGSLWSYDVAETTFSVLATGFRFGMSTFTCFIAKRVNKYTKNNNRCITYC